MSITPGFPNVGIDRQGQIGKPKNMDFDEPLSLYLPIYILTAVFGALFLIGPLVVPKGPNRGITRACIMLTAFCLWIFWVTVYVGQMHPLLGPRLHNTSMAWLGYKWGKDPKTLSKQVEERK